MIPMTGFHSSDGLHPIRMLRAVARRLRTDQRYLIWKRVHEKSAEWQARQRKIAESANKARSEAAKGRQRNEDGTLRSALTPAWRCEQCDTECPDGWSYCHECKAERPSSASTSSGQTGSQRGPGSAAKATASKTNRGSVERMDRLDRERPDLAEKVIAGELKAAEAMRQLRRDEVAVKVAALPKGKYRIIYADPPWRFGEQN